VVVGVIGLAAPGSAGMAGASLPSKPVRIPPGSYAGLVSWSTGFGGGPGLEAQSQGVGPLRIVATDSSVSGTWGWSGHGRGSLTRGSIGGTVDAALSFSGVATGRPDAVQLDGTFMINGTFTGSGQAEGLGGPINASIDGSFPLPVHSASCQKIAGDFTPQFKENLGGAGLNLKTVAGKWMALRVPVKLSGDLQASIDALINDVDALSAMLDAGEPIDNAKLQDVLLRAQLFAKKLPVDKTCKTTKKGAEHSLFLNVYVGRLIGAALPRADSLRLDELTDLAITGHRTGLFPGSDPISRDLETRLRDAIDKKLTEAISSSDTLGIQLVEKTAKELGWKDLADRAVKARKG
jgi:hypothetical protein